MRSTVIVAIRRWYILTLQKPEFAENSGSNDKPFCRNFQCYHFSDNSMFGFISKHFTVQSSPVLDTSDSTKCNIFITSNNNVTYIQLTLVIIFLDVFLCDQEHRCDKWGTSGRSIIVRCVALIFGWCDCHVANCSWRSAPSVEISISVVRRHNVISDVSLFSARCVSSHQSIPPPGFLASGAALSVGKKCTAPFSYRTNCWYQ